MLTRFLFFSFYVMKVFWTSIFWIVVFFLVVFYLKTFDDTMGSKVASWISATPIVANATGTQDAVLSGLVNVQTTLDAMTQKMDDIATKLGITAVVTSGVIPTITTS
jgi:hypothetical protein